MSVGFSIFSHFELKFYFGSTDLIRKINQQDLVVLSLQTSKLVRYHNRKNGCESSLMNLVKTQGGTFEWNTSN